MIREGIAVLFVERDRMEEIFIWYVAGPMIYCGYGIRAGPSRVG